MPLVAIWELLRLNPAGAGDSQPLDRAGDNMGVLEKSAETDVATLAGFSRSVRVRLLADERVESLSHGGISLYFVRDFMSDAECDALIELIDATAKPSTLYAGTEIDGFRTSYSGNLNRHHPLVRELDKRVCELTGIDPRHGETMQGQRYAVGQQFKPHHDYFHTDQSYWQAEKENGGQRSWTAMTYLNTPAGGGETNFPKAGVYVPPCRGVLVLWNNMSEDGTPNDHSLHEGCPVKDGTKYVFTKWFREKHWAPD